MNEPVETEATPVQVTEVTRPTDNFAQDTTVAVQIFHGGPREMLDQAIQYANTLADVIRAKHLYKTIGNKNHVLVEGWTFLGSLLGAFPVVKWTRKLEDGWEARVEVWKAGQIIGAAEASCTREEANWKSRDDYALRSMAQTRATGKALRLPLGFIVVLAGYNATPAEEMPPDGFLDAPKAPRGNPMPPRTPKSASGLSTEEHLAEAKKRREEALEKHGPDPMADWKKTEAELRPGESPKDALERIRKKANSEAGRGDVPDWCQCGAAVLKFEASNGSGSYWECSNRHRARKIFKEANVPAEEYRNDKTVAGHFHSWAGKAGQV